MGDNLGLLIHLLLSSRPVHRHLQRLLIGLGIGVNLGLGQLGQAGHQLVLVNTQSSLSALCGRWDVVGSTLSAVLDINEANHFSRLYLVLVTHLDTVHEGPPGFFAPVYLAHRWAIVGSDGEAVQGAVGHAAPVLIASLQHVHQDISLLQLHLGGRQIVHGAATLVGVLHSHRHGLRSAPASLQGQRPGDQSPHHGQGQ